MLSIAHRRAITDRAMSHADFRDLMLSDPRRAVMEATGASFSSDERVEVVREGDVAWSFVLVDPAEIDATLPEPQDARSAVENEVYTLLRDEPGVADVAAADPVAFLRERFGVEVTAVDLRRESKGETLLVLPNIGSREELPDDMLDLVAGGGDSGSQSADWSSQRTIEGDVTGTPVKPP
jgi:hypothetical protein